MSRPIAAAILALLSVTVLLSNFPAFAPPDEDAGTFLYVASVIRDGGFPYRDVWDHKPPLVYLIDLVGLAIAGSVGVWILEVLALFAAAWIGYLIFSREFGWRVALFACAAFVLATPRVTLTHSEWSNFTELFAIPLQFAAVWLYLRGGGARSTLAIGALCGLCFLLKPSLIGVGVAIALHLAFVTAQRRVWRDLVARYALLAAGTLLPLTLVALWLASGEALDDGIDQAILFNLAYSGSSTLIARLEAAALGVRLLLPNGLILLALGGAIVSIASRTRLPVVQLALIGLPLEVILATTSGRPYLYYFLPWLWTLAILSAAGIAWGERWLRQMRPGLMPFAAAALAFGLAFRPLALVANQVPDPGNGWTDAAAAYVAEHTAPPDTVLIWGSRSAVLYLSDRRSPTRYVYQYTPLFSIGYGSAERVAEMLDELRRSPPKLVVDSSPTAHATPPIDPTIIPDWLSPDPQYQPPDEFAAVAAWIRENYELADIIPVADWPVWRLRD